MRISKISKTLFDRREMNAANTLLSLSTWEKERERGEKKVGGIIRHWEFDNVYKTWCLVYFHDDLQLASSIPSLLTVGAF